MIVLICSTLVVVAVVGMIYILDLLITYWCGTDKACPKIKFKAFKKFYSINPDRWTLEYQSVVCQIVNEEKSAYRGLFYTYDNERFYFTLFDYIRYKIFRKRLAKDKLNKEHMESTAKMLGMVKKDIANMENLAEQQKKKAMDNLNDILKNLGGTK